MQAGSRSPCGEDWRDAGGADEEVVQRNVLLGSWGGEGSQSLHAAEIRAVREEHFKVWQLTDDWLEESVTGCDWMKWRREKRDIMKLLVTSVHTNTAIFGDGVLKKNRSDLNNFVFLCVLPWTTAVVINEHEHWNNPKHTQTQSEPNQQILSVDLACRCSSTSLHPRIVSQEIITQLNDWQAQFRRVHGESAP